MSKKVTLDEEQINSLAKEIQSEFPNIAALYISQEHYVLIDFVKKDYNIDTMLALKAYLSKIWPNNRVELLVKDFVDKEILKELMTDAICVFET